MEFYKIFKKPYINKSILFNKIWLKTITILFKIKIKYKVIFKANNMIMIIKFN